MSADIKLKEFESKMTSTIGILNSDLSSIRTGRAHISMLDLIKVEVYGQKLPINQLGTVTVPESQMVTVQVWDAKPFSNGWTEVDAAANHDEND